MPDPNGDAIPTRVWLQVPGYPEIEMRQEHDPQSFVTVTEARTMRNGERITTRAAINDEVLATAPPDVVVEHQVHTVASLMRHVNALDERLAQHVQAVPEIAEIVTRTLPEAAWYAPRGTPVLSDWNAPSSYGAVRLHLNDWVAASATYATSMSQLRRSMIDWQHAWNAPTTTTIGVGNGNTIQTEWGRLSDLRFTLTGTLTASPHIWIPQRPLTVAERAVAAGQVLMRAAPDQALRQIAEAMSEALLAELVGMKQFNYWRTNGVIFVTSQKFRKKIRYEIRHDDMIRLHEHTSKGWRRRRDKLCIHPLHKHPRGDEVAALFALASFDEDTLWKVANHHFADEETPLPLAA